jgi:hypothetical protein
MTSLLRTGGALASSLLCMHSLTFLLAPAAGPLSLFRRLHNLADVCLFLIFGLSGIVAELFPKDSFSYRILKSNVPFLNTLIGRGLFYVLLGFVVMGDYRSHAAISRLLTQDDSDAPDDSLGYFSILSGSYISLVGIGLLVTAYKSQRRSLSSELTQPIVAFVPSMGTGAMLERAAQVEIIHPDPIDSHTPV